MSKTNIVKPIDGNKLIEILTINKKIGDIVFMSINDIIELINKQPLVESIDVIDDALNHID